MDASVTLDQFVEEWLSDVREGNPSTVELGRRFARKLVTQWLDVDDSSDDLVFCDGSGDGGIDVAYLDRGADGEEEPSPAAAVAHTWYLMQSKYGCAFRGTATLIEESQKVIDTLDGKRQRLSSLAEGLLDRLSTFRKQASERDRIVLVFATDVSLSEEQRRALADVRAMGRGRLGPLFDVESVSVEAIYRRSLEEEAPAAERLKILLRGALVSSGNDLLVGCVSVLELYAFLHAYRNETDDLDQLYEKNVRRFLGSRRKVNRAIHDTLAGSPELFGLYNNGITMVVADYQRTGDGEYSLVEPFIVNGCQTTRSIWEVCHQRLESGGTGSSPELEEWKRRAGQGIVVTKIVRVGNSGDALLQAITRYTNSQNAVSEKDFLALTADFRDWARQMGERYNVFLEVQRGGWDSQRALQRQKPGTKQYALSAYAFDLLKVFGSGWLGEAGLAFSKNAPFLPNGSVFKRITAVGEGDGEPFGVDDLYAAYLLRIAADRFGFGRGAKQVSRRQSRFLFYMVVIDLLKDILSRCEVKPGRASYTRAILKVFATGNETARDGFLDAAAGVIDTYLIPGTDESVHDEPSFKNTFNSDLNAFLKWEKLGKSEEDCPRLRTLLAVSKQAMGARVAGQPSVRDLCMTVIRS